MYPNTNLTFFFLPLSGELQQSQHLINKNKVEQFKWFTVSLLLQHQGDILSVLTRCSKTDRKGLTFVQSEHIRGFSLALPSHLQYLSLDLVFPTVLDFPRHSVCVICQSTKATLKSVTFFFFPYWPLQNSSLTLNWSCNTQFNGKSLFCCLEIYLLLNRRRYDCDTFWYFGTTSSHSFGEEF